MTARETLARRQREVLDDLLAGRVPAGFDPVGSAATTRVLHRRRSAAALHVAPELAQLPGWRDRFHAWAAAHPAEGCAHDDVRGFAASLARTDPDGLRLLEVHDGARRVAWIRIDGRRVLLVRLRDSVLRLTQRRRREPTTDRSPT
ncbi:hypothetical protein [Nocardioides flavescens]|uniref:SCO6045-like C-terminal domain-containing protein n=1 Tax=Nocardioides flavescens TaxID=2691959 RepID=A0A6L7EVJ6_9ACTN|nr:hypothetical protein [Nocardioides flavescens]MXG91423.1 hypothetical protein [Nocardioides flavescens]